ncbi:MAG: hypothetical protein WA840_07910 [Caulobacteraceae bacterium]
MSPDPDQPPQGQPLSGPSVRSPSVQPPGVVGERPCPMVDRMLHLAGANPGWRVGVVGPASAATMIALCRKGFDRAVSIQGGVCPAAEGDCDLLLVTGPNTSEGLSASVHLGLGLLRDGGVLVAHECGLKDDSLIGAALRTSGREIGWRVHDMAEGCLVALQVLRAGAASAVAASVRAA